MHGFTLALVSVELPNTVYPVNEFYEAVSVLEDTGSATVSVTITHSSYTGTTLATEVADALTTESAISGGSHTYTGSYDSATKKITISSDDAFAYRPIADDIYEEMGITTLDADVAASVEGDYHVNISGSAYVDLVSNLATLNHSSTRIGGNILARIPLAGAFGDLIHIQYPDPSALQPSSPELHEIRLRLLDDRGNIWHMPPTAHLSVTFRIDPLENELAPPHSASNHDAVTGYQSLGHSIRK